VVTHGPLVGQQSCEFEVDIVVAGAGAGGGSLGVHFVCGAPSSCLQHSVNAAIEVSRGIELGRYSVVFLYFFAAVVVHQYDCGALRFSRLSQFVSATERTFENGF
jgi:hypothetical protein